MFPKTLISCIALGMFPIGAYATPAFNWDFQTYYPHAEAQPASLTAPQLASINQLDGYYPTGMINPNGAGLTTAEFDEVQAMPAYFALSRDPVSGVLTGRGIVVDDEGSAPQPNLTSPASFNGDFVTKVIRLTDLYARASTAQAPVLEQVYSDLIEHYLDQGYLPGGPAPWMGNGYAWRDRGWKTLRMVHKLSADKRDLYALSIAYISGYAGLVPDNAYASTDTYHTYLATAHRSMALMSDTPAKWQFIKLIRRGLDISIIGKEGNPKAQLVPLDGSIIHHDGHHISYAGYSYAGMLSTHTSWTAAGFTSPYTADCVARMRKGSLAWCFATTGGLNPAHQNMRSGLLSGSSLGDGGAGNGLDFAIKAATLTSTYYGTPLADDLEMAYAAIAKAGVGSTSLPVEWRTITPPSNPDRNSPLYTASLLGHYSHTTNGTSIQRGPGQWYASIRSQNSHWRGGEGYDAMGLPDHFNVKSMHSALMLITTGKSGRKPNEVDSGFRYEGWDYSYYPNVTCPDYSPGSLLYWRTPAYFGGEGALTGSANLRESGVWMAQGTARKSAFFLGNRIVLATTDVNGNGLHTGLIQYAHTAPSSEPLTVDGSVQTQDGDWTLTAGGNHKIVDPQGNAYFIHPGAKTPEMKVRRGLQKWIYPFASSFIGSGTAPSFTYASDFLARMNEFAPTTSTYSKVWFDHGSGAAGQSLEYTVLVKPQPGDLDAYASAMATPSTAPVVVSKNSNIHHYYDRITGTTAVAVFNPAEAVNQEGVLNVNRAGAYIWRRDGDLLSLSVSSADVYNTTPFQITLGGTWTLESSEDTYSVSATPSGANTVVSLSMRQAAPQKVVLRKVSGAEWASLSSTVDTGSLYSAYGLNLDAAGLGTSPSYTILSDSSAGLFAVSGNQLVATRAFVPADAGDKLIAVQVTQGGSVLGTIAVQVKVTDTAFATATTDSDGDGFRDAFEMSKGTNPNDPVDKPTTALIAYWDFNQTGTPCDLIGGVQGTFTAGAAYSADGAGYGGGTGNRGLDLGNGAGQRMEVSNVTNLNRATLGNKLTISFWQKLDTVANSYPFWAISPSSADSQRGIAAHTPHSGSIYFDVGGSSTANRVSVATPSGLNWTQWVHVAFVKDGGTSQIWINGVLRKSESGKVALKTDHTLLQIGSGYNGLSSVRGDMDDFAIFNTALNSTQIAALASGNSPLTITAVANQPPAITTSTLSIPENSPGSSVVGNAAISDPDGSAPYTWSIQGTALGDLFSIDSATGAISTTSSASLNYEARSSYTLNVGVKDAMGASSLRQVTVNVSNVNDAPAFANATIAGAGATEGSSYSSTIAGSAIDEDAGDTLTYSKVSGPAWLSIASNGVLSGTPPWGSAGANAFTVRVTDGASASNDATLTIQVTKPAGSGDADGDGYTNALEEALGTNPYLNTATPDSIYSGLKAWWRLNDVTGTIAKDTTGAAQDGTLINGPAWSSGVENGALTFDGSNDKMDLNYGPTLLGSTDFSACAWVKLNAGAGAGTILMQRDASASGYLGEYVLWTRSDGKVEFFIYNDNVYQFQLVSPQAINDGKWHQLTAVRSGTNGYLYIDGALAIQGSGTIRTLLSRKVYVGYDGRDNNKFLNGQLDDVRLYNRALSATEAGLLHSQLALPLPWTNATVGTGALAGKSLHANGTFTVSGSGVLDGTADQANYASQTLTGDGEIVAKLQTLHNTGTSASVGVMVRDSLASNAAHVFVGSDGAGTYRWSSRSTAGGSTTTTSGSAGTAGSMWVKLNRSGSTFTVSTSADGATWSTLGTTSVTMASNCYIGLSVSSGSATTINTSQFSNVSVTP